MRGRGNPPQPRITPRRAAGIILNSFPKCSVVGAVPPWRTRIRLPFRLRIALAPRRTLSHVTSPKMKIRLLFLTVVCALAAGPGLRSAEPETELGGKMEKMGGAFRAIRRQISDSSKNADTLAKLATLKSNAEASLKFEPAKKAEIPSAEQKKFVADYQAGMKKLIELANKLEAALKANNNEEAAKLCGEMGDAQKKGHKQFKIDDKKK